MLVYDSHTPLKNDVPLCMNKACRLRMGEASACEENHVSGRISQSFTSLIVRAVFIFEPLAPRFISYYLGQKLEEWKEQGVISEFEVKTKRLGKFHYKIILDLDVTSEQARQLLDDLLPNTAQRKEVN